jgi:Zn-dependent protease
MATVAKAPHFRIAGIPVRVEVSFFLVIGALGWFWQDPNQPFQWSLLASWMVIAFLSILLHEMGHAVVFRRYGIRPRISLQGLGGLTTGSGQLRPGQRALVSLAGPLSALLLVGLPAALVWQSGSVSSDTGLQVLYQVLWINVGWSVLNLFPILPLDGGQVALSLLEMVTKGHGQRMAEVLSIGVAVVLSLIGFAFGQPFIAVFAILVVMLNIGAMRGMRPVDPGLGQAILVGQQALVQHRPADAERVAQQVLAQPGGISERGAAELLAWSRLWQGDQAGAEAVIASYAQGAPPSASFRGAQALAAGRLVEGVSIIAWAFANDSSSPFLVLGAIAVAGTGQTRPLTAELLRIDGPAGVRGAQHFHQLLQHAGYGREAEAVASMLVADGRTSLPS